MPKIAFCQRDNDINTYVHCQTAIISYGKKLNRLVHTIVRLCDVPVLDPFAFDHVFVMCKNSFLLLQTLQKFDLFQRRDFNQMALHAYEP